MSFAIFKVKPITTLQGLGAIGAHNNREKEAYQSKPDIDLSKCADNITLVDCPNYHTKYMQIVAPYKKQHDEKQKIERETRKKSFSKMLDDSNSVVADEMLFTSDPDFFEDKSKEEIITWAEKCMEFVYKDIGYIKEQILSATIHMDETTPHLHCVVVPLIQKYDKRTKTEKFTINKKNYIKSNFYLSFLQDKYWERLVNAGYDLDRGIKNIDDPETGLHIRDYKALTKKLNYAMNKRGKNLEKAITKFEENMETSKPTIIGDDIRVKQTTFDSMKKVVKEAKNVLNEVPAMQNLIDDMSTFTNSYKNLETKNKALKANAEFLEKKTKRLEKENQDLWSYLKAVVKALKGIFRNILLLGKKYEKDEVVEEIKDYFDNKAYDKQDIVEVAIDTDKEDELFNYANIDKNYDFYDKDIEI